MSSMRQYGHRTKMKIDPALALQEQMQKSSSEHLAPLNKAAPGLEADRTKAAQDAAATLKAATPRAKLEQERHKERVAVAKELRDERYVATKRNLARDRSRQRGRDSENER